MYQIVYVSEAREAFSPNDVKELLKIARSRNKINGVTGMLVSCDGQFLQVLEGDPAAVISTFDRIAEDPRHENLLVLHRGYSHVGKTFTGSSMGFNSLALNEGLPPGFIRKDNRLRIYEFDGLMALDFLVACQFNMAN